MSGLEVRLAVVIFLLVSIPGWAFLSVTRVAREYTALQRWILAILLGACFYPALFYLARAVAPSFAIGLNKILLLLALFLGLIAWRQWKTWRLQFTFDRLEGMAILIFAATVFTRFWMAHLHPYPAWADSLHHTLLTQLVAQHGQLPYTLEPYEPSSLDMYHLGLYAVSGLVQMITRAPAYSALLWTAQFLNGICGLGVYFVLDRLGSRRGALVGALVVGLLSFQPAWYVNWGRFTQVASQAVLLVAWLVTWEAVRRWRSADKPFFQAIRSRELLELTLAAGLLNAGVFLFHFRVYALYLPLLGISLAWEALQALRAKKLAWVAVSAGLVGIFALVFVLPALLPSLSVYVQAVHRVQAAGSAAAQGDVPNLSYYEVPATALFDLGIQPWLMILTAAAAITGLLFGDGLTILILVWIGGVWAIGHAYMVGLFWLTLMNYSGILIGIYLPAACLIGRAIDLVICRIPQKRRESLQGVFAALLLLAGFAGSHMRVGGVEDYRYFLTAADVRAMEWINANLPQDAVFAINTYVWLGSAPHGTDGGYWIPYFTGRKTTLGTMMFTSAPPEYVNRVRKLAGLTQQIDQAAQLKELCAQGVAYAFLGKNGNPIGKPIDAGQVLKIPGTALLYQQDGVSILQLCKKQP